jgi:tetratricopeptide (TPR) repeat protein
MGDSATDPHFIETIPRRGYRFIGEVERNGAPDPEISLRSASPEARSWRKYAAISALMILPIAGVFFLWFRARPKAISDQDVLVLADFANSTDDPVFDNTLREALAFQLEQSPFLKILDDDVMRQDLQLMRRSSQEHITNDLARDICMREADAATIEGSIAGLGRHYVIELKATNCQTAATLARELTEAVDKEHVLEALVRATQGMRAKLGESLSSIRKLAPPKFQVTTGSIEAFQAFHTGQELYRQGRYSESVPFLRRATELDPNLAFAWMWLSVAYYNSGGSRERYEAYNDRAWALRDQVSAYERLWITSSRDGQSRARYIEDYETWAQTYPRDILPLIQLGRLHRSAGEFKAALDKFQQAYRLDSRRAIAGIDLMQMYARLDRFDEAKAVAEKAFAQGEDAPLLHHQLLLNAYAAGDSAGAGRQIEWFVGKPEEYLSWADRGAEARVRGELRKSRKLLQRAAELAQLRNLPDAAIGFLNPDTGAEALIGNCEPVRNTGLDARRFLAFPASDAALALCATPALVHRSEELNERWISGVQKNPAQVSLTRAASQLGLGHPERAIELLRLAAPYEAAWPMTNYLRGLAWLRLRRGAEASTEFQKILDHRGADWGPLYPLSYVGLARGAALGGDIAKARKAYEDFFAFWKDADSDVPILITARREYAMMHH